MDLASRCLARASAQTLFGRGWPSVAIISEPLGALAITHEPRFARGEYPFREFRLINGPRQYDGSDKRCECRERFIVVPLTRFYAQHFAHRAGKTLEAFG